MKHKSLTCLLFLTLLLMGSLCAQVRQPAANSPEVTALKAQVATMREYQDRFLDIVQWSLGTVVTITIGLLAFGWYTNKTTYDRDRDALRQERDSLRHELRALVSDEIRRVSQELETAASAAEKPLQERLEKSFASKLSRYDSRLDSITGDILTLQASNVEREAMEAMQKKRYNWAIYKYCDALELSVKRQADHYEVPDILDAIKQALQSPGLKLDADDITRMVEILGRLPTRYQAAAENLIELAKSLQ